MAVEYPGAGSSITKGLFHLESSSIDSSGNSHNGTDTAITYNAANGYFGQGAGFNGTTSKIALPTGAKVGNLSAYTLSLWFKTSVTTSQYFHGEGNSGTATPFIVFGSNISGAGDVGVSMRNDASTLTTFVSGSTYNNNLWHNAIFVKVNDSSRIVYVDGVNIANSSVTLGTITLNTQHIGCLQRTSTIGFYNGAIDEVFWKMSLGHKHKLLSIIMRAAAFSSSA